MFFVRNLGVILDNNRTMSQHVLRVSLNCYFQFLHIRRLGKALSAESKLLLVRALIHSLLDFCKSVLACLPWSLKEQLQSVLNSAAHLIFSIHYLCPNGIALASIPSVHYIQ